MAEQYPTSKHPAATFRLPVCRTGKVVHCINWYHKCPDCGSRLWYSQPENIFFCKTKGCYYVGEVEELRELVQPKIDLWNNYMSDREKDAELRRRKKADEERDRQEREKEAVRKKLTAVVYYIEFGTRIKIGTTTNIVGRMADLPWERILLMEPGSYEMEKKRHEQFADQHVTLEWFDNAAPLTNFIETRRNELSEFNASRFPEQGEFPWDRGSISLSGLRHGNCDPLFEGQWESIRDGAA